MDFLTYIQILQQELLTYNLTKDEIHCIITQESALAETKEPIEIKAFFTYERIEMLAKKAKTQKAPLLEEDETKTIVPQGCLKNNIYSSPDEEKTIMPTTTRTTLHSLTDEATMVVISGNTDIAIEEKTIAASPDLKKLLSENETVRISEKDTVFFQTPQNNEIPLPQEDETVQHVPLTRFTKSSLNTDATLAIPKQENVTTAPITEQTRPIPTTNHEPSPSTPTPDHFPKDKDTKNESTPSIIALSPENIRNPHPYVSFFWLTVLLVPSLCFLTVLIAFFIIAVNSLFLLAFTLSMFFYLSFLLVPLFIALYSFVFAFLYWNDSHVTKGIAEIGIALFSSGLSLMLGYLFYRPFVSTVEKISQKFKSFNKKTFLLIRNLYRYAVKGAEKL